MFADDNKGQNWFSELINMTIYQREECEELKIINVSTGGTYINWMYLLEWDISVSIETGIDRWKEVTGGEGRWLANSLQKLLISNYHRILSNSRGH